MNPVQYILINKGLGMSAGKMAAQAAHASVEGVRISAREPGSNPWDASIVNRWYRGGHYAKIVLEVADAAALQTALEYIRARGFKAVPIIDEGRTELNGLTWTAVGCEIVDKDWPHARETFSVFKLYKDQSSFIATVPASKHFPTPSLGRWKRMFDSGSRATAPTTQPRSNDGDSTRQQVGNP